MFAAAAPLAITPAQAASGLLYPDRGWDPAALSFSIPGASGSWAGYADGSEPLAPNRFTPFDTIQAGRFVDAMIAWDRLISPTIVQTEDSLDPGSLRAGFTDSASVASGWGLAVVPPLLGVEPVPRNGDIWINADRSGSAFEAGAYDFEALLHEIGHALGLKHPFEAPILPAEFDNRRYTLMSYFDPVGAHAVVFNLTASALEVQYVDVDPATPMVLDIAALQFRYGADPATEAGDTIYAFDASRPFLQALYDAGGIDTIDASRFTRPSDLDLTPGAYSSLGYHAVADQIAEAVEQYAWAESFIRRVFANVSPYSGAQNLGIAYSTVIENAVGGAGGDTLTGNEASNGLYGSGGDDYIRGLDGDDVVEGGDGDDYVNGNAGSDLVRGGEGADTVLGGQGADTVYGDGGADPHVNGNRGADLVHGGAGNDTVHGGQGDDTLHGDSGDDRLSGDLGADLLFGGPGADRFVIRVGFGLDRVADFDPDGGDRVELMFGTLFTLTSLDGAPMLDLGAGDGILLAGAEGPFLADWLVYA